MKFIPGMRGCINLGKCIDVIHHINGMKEKKIRIATVNAEKAIEEIQEYFHD